MGPVMGLASGVFLDGSLVSTRHEMPIDVYCNLDGMMSHLLLHIRKRFALLNKQRREGMPKILHLHMAKSRLGQET